jgi:type VI secretion system secreted protein Hcp
MAFDAFFQVKTPDIVGESSDTKFGKAIEILSFSMGVSNPATIGSATGGGAGGKASFSPFSIMKRTDSASPVLMQGCASGVHYASAVLSLRKAGGATALVYLTYTFSEVFIESIQWSGSTGGDDVPTESVSFAYGQLQVSYQPQSKTGTAQGAAIPGGWSVLTNQKA